ncbi:MAG TPA: hypothetical protein VEC39_03550 [Vicinamibacterales bacterium]|nr:hypothetical protein [Vicinamibacterales bacterium]
MLATTPAVPGQYPVSCPHCDARAGVPVAVMTVANDPSALRLDFRCGSCHHKWWQQFTAAFSK